MFSREGFEGSRLAKRATILGEEAVCAILRAVGEGKGSTLTPE